MKAELLSKLEALEGVLGCPPPGLAWLGLVLTDLDNDIDNEFGIFM